MKGVSVMSWSISLRGTPATVARSLEEHSAGLTGQSKVEYDGALPHLAALVRENFVAEGGEHPEPTIALDAFGSGSARETVGSGEVKQLLRSCSVHLRQA
jgi:hypothetical protein